MLGLLGPNGAGKTTLINILSTLLPPTSGSATVAGHDVVEEADSVRRAIALTGQFAALDDMLTGDENLVFFGRLRGLSIQDARSRSGELLQRFSLTEAGAKRDGGYSGGMRRRLDLAASLVVPPEVLFLDEPTTGLDPRSRNELWDVVRELRSDGLTIVLTTQYLEEADQLADRIVVIDEGRIVAEGTADQLKEQTGGRSLVVKPVTLGQLTALTEIVASVGPHSIDTQSGTLTVADADVAMMTVVLREAEAHGIDLADVSLRAPTLDEVFLRITSPSTHTGTPA